MGVMMYLGGSDSKTPPGLQKIDDMISKDSDAAEASMILQIEFMTKKKKKENLKIHLKLNADLISSYAE